MMTINGITVTSEMIQGAVQTLATIATFLGGMAAAWWRASRWLHRFLGQADALRDELTRNVAELKTELQRLTAASAQLHDQVLKLETRLDVRETDHAKIEGKVEMANTTMVRVIATLQQCNSSIEALWRTMQRLFPDQVPKRASDRL